MNQETGVGIVYEDLAGWHTEIFNYRIKESSTSFEVLVEEAKAVLSRDVHGKEDHPLHGLITMGALALWLMATNDGTGMGEKLMNGAGDRELFV